MSRFLTYDYVGSLVFRNALIVIGSWSWHVTWAWSVPLKTHATIQHLKNVNVWEWSRNHFLKPSNQGKNDSQLVSAYSHVPNEGHDLRDSPLASHGCWNFLINDLEECPTALAWTWTLTITAVLDCSFWLYWRCMFHILPTNVSHRDKHEMSFGNQRLPRT